MPDHKLRFIPDYVLQDLGKYMEAATSTPKVSVVLLWPYYTHKYVFLWNIDRKTMKYSFYGTNLITYDAMTPNVR